MASEKRLINRICRILGRICDWLYEERMAGYDRELLEQVEREICSGCRDRDSCIGALPLPGGVFPCRRAGDRYWELEAEKED